MQKITNGRRFGENHQNAILSDAEVELIRQLREDCKMSYQKLADKFEAGKSTIFDICKYRRR